MNGCYNTAEARFWDARWKHTGNVVTFERWNLGALDHAGCCSTANHQRRARPKEDGLAHKMPMLIASATPTFSRVFIRKVQIIFQGKRARTASIAAEIAIKPVSNRICLPDEPIQGHTYQLQTQSRSSWRWRPNTSPESSDSSFCGRDHT